MSLNDNESTADHWRMIICRHAYLEKISERQQWSMRLGVQIVAAKHASPTESCIVTRQDSSPCGARFTASLTWPRPLAQDYVRCRSFAFTCLPLHDGVAESTSNQLTIFIGRVFGEYYITTTVGGVVRLPFFPLHDGCHLMCYHRGREGVVARGKTQVVGLCGKIM